MAKGSSRIANWVSQATGGVKPSAAIPPKPTPAIYQTKDFVPPNLPAPNAEPASQGEMSLDATMQNVKDATFGKRGAPAPENK